MSMAEIPQPSDFEVVVNNDGTLPVVPAETLARFGIRPGMRLHLVPESEQVKRKSIMGALEGQIDVEAFEEAMAWGKQDRISQVIGEDDDQ